MSPSKASSFLLSDIQLQILMCQELAPESTAYVQTILIKNANANINLQQLARDLVSNFPILGFVPIKTSDGWKLHSKDISTRVCYEMTAEDDIQVSSFPLNSHLFKIGKLGSSTIAVHVHQLLVDSYSLQMIQEYVENYPSNQGQKTVPQTINGFLNASPANAPDIEQIKKRFASHSFPTFLASPSTGQIVQQMPASTIHMKLDIDLQKICSKLDFSPEEFFTGCFTLTLQRYLGPDSVNFCTPVNTRTKEQISSVGPFYNILPMAFKIPLDKNVDEFFPFLKQELGFYSKFRNIAFSTLFQELKMDLQSPYSHLFIYQKTSGNRGEKIIPKYPMVAFSLEIDDDANGNGVSLYLTWAKPLLEDRVGNYFLKSFINCCEILSKSTAGSLSLKELDVMSYEEKSFLSTLLKKSHPSKKYSAPITQFDKNVLLSPSKISVYGSCGQYTSTHLQSWSCQIAKGLLSKFPNLSSAPVVLLMEKNFHCISSVLGIWRAGGYFIPIDANMQERITDLQSSGLKVTCILTNFAHIGKELPETLPKNWPVVQVDKLLSTNEPVEIFNAEPSPSAPAYMTMTSGSTGKPKRCINTHGGLYHLMEAAREEFALDQDSNLLQWVPFAFDVFIEDVIKGLFCCNGTLTVITSVDRFQVDRVAQRIASYGVNFLHMTPQFALFALQQEPTLMNNVKTLALGGESLTWSTLKRLKKLLPPSTKVYNCYGLTEAAVESTVFPIPSAPEELEYYQKHCQFVPIGRPMRGITNEILDPNTLLQSPVGVKGVLAISGPTLGSGDIPITSVGDKKIFLTGDSAVWLTTGQINFIGRDEEQTLKVGGNRINCGELEGKILSSDVSIDSAVALAVNSSSEENGILAAAIQTSKNIDTRKLQEKLRNRMPYYMVPQVIVQLPKLPLTGNGKIDRKALQSLAASEYKKLLSGPHPSDTNEENKANAKMEEFLIQKLSEVSNRPIESIKSDVNLRDQGFTSFELMKFSNLLLKEESVKNFEGVSDIFRYSTPELLAKKLQNQLQIPHSYQNYSASSAKIPKSPPSDPISIVGMSFRLPGNISTIPDFWDHMSKGTCFVRTFPENRSEDVLTSMTRPFQSSAVSASFFPRIDEFDNEFFHIASNEAKHMCPEQRLFLEIATESLVDSGMNLSSLDGSSVGVYCTASDIEYGIIDPSLEGVAVVGRQSSVLPSRLSYTFNLKGGNYVVDTACSAALTILEQAVRDLRAGQCSAAVVGGVNIYLYPATDGLMGTNLIHSPSSTCRAFDDQADGTASGEGAFAYVLKRQSDALKDGNYIYANIESICSNAVGRGNGITAPSVDSQVSVIQDAIEQAGLGVDDIDFLETHGTGTVLGDQIELCALASAFNSRENPLVIGVTKPQFGHLDMAAGFLSILKAQCALTFNSAPEMKHIKTPSKYLDFSVFKTESSQIVKDKKDKAFAGISAYGLSGTNCHAVLSIDNKSAKKNPVSNKVCKFLLPIIEPAGVPLEEQCQIYSKYAKFYSESISLADICGTQISNLVNFNLNKKAQMKVAVMEASSMEELIKRFDAIGNGITSFSTAQFQSLSTQEMSAILPESTWTRVPCLPKFLFRKIRHWLNPVEQERQQLQQPSKMMTIPELELLLNNKTAECQSLLEAAHKLQEMVNKFSFGVMSDLLNAKSSTQDFTPSQISGGDPKLEDNSSSNTSNKQLQQAKSKSNSPISDEKMTYDEIYKIILDIWIDCLGCTDITPTSIFRDLGGDSLLTVQMTKLLSAKFNLKIKAADAFAHPSLCTLSALIFNTLNPLLNAPEVSFDDPKLLGMPMKMIMFPGQGSQKPNMCTSLLNSCPAALDIFKEAEKITEMSIISNLSNPESFENTEFVQVCLFLGSLAKIQELKSTSPEILEGIRCVGGLSVGEFAALVFAEAVEWQDALKIVQYRGKVMQEAIDSSSSTGMVSVFGPDKDAFGPWMKKEFPDMKFCTFLGDNQFAVGGPIETCRKLVEERAEELETMGVIDIRILRVAGAFHTDYMKEAGVKTAHLIDKLEIKFPRFGIIMNFDGDLATTKESVRFNLKKQTSCPVLWRDTVVKAHEMGVRKFFEISPSNVLTPIIKKRIKGLEKCEVELLRF